MPRLLGVKLTHLRQSHTQALSQAELARVLGLSRQFIHNVEAGRKTPRITVIAQMAVFFQVSIDWLIRDDLAVELVKEFHNPASFDTSSLLTLFPLKLKYQREQRGWTQVDLAQRLGTRTQAHISYLEAGEKASSVPMLERIAEVFDRRIDYFVFDSIAADADGWEI